jgi:DNA repair protein RadA
MPQKRKEKTVTDAVEEIKTEETEEEGTPQELEDLPGVGPTTADKLRDAGYDTIMSIAVAPVAQIANSSGMTQAGALKAQIVARNAMDMGFSTGSELVKKRTIIERLTTGAEELDELLGGGIETQSISEAYGAFGSGKSQIAMQLAVNVQLPKKDGGLNADVVFIDTENTFRPERITQMAEARGVSPKKILDRIMVARAYTSDHQMLLVDKVDELINREGKNIKLVIVDSLMSLFRSEYAGRGTLAVRQQKLNRHLHALQRLADKHNLAVYVTNQVMSKPDVFFGNPTAAIGGHILGHASQFRLYLRRGKAGKRIARLVDSPCLPEGEAIFKITERGIEAA